ncbi:GntR family transcriptional regulator [Kineococcus sp. SYSU DK003]|uniref:GntR family transcriptional regulator n=1 Tax=Kineococcus sp. SYSU DK003 TaxID=3383124 RepID=UPI003D7CF2DE
MTAEPLVGGLRGVVSLRDQALEVLRQRLVSGELRPGEIYSVTALADELGVSNSPVREAMLDLQHAGLVEAVRNRGFRVVQLSERERLDVLEVRLMLEVPAMARLTGDHRLRAEKARFEAIAAEITAAAEAGSMVEFLQADRRFHLGLLGLLGNDELVSVVAGLRDRTRLLADPAAVLRSAQEHVALLEALAAADPQVSARLMREHLQHVREDWSESPLDAG